MESCKDSVSFIHNDMRLDYLKTEKGLYQNSFNTINNCVDTSGYVMFPNYQLAVSGVPHGFNSALVTGYTNLPLEMDMESFEKTNNNIVFTYRHRMLGLVAIINMQLYKGVNVIRFHTRIINNGNEPVTLTHVSSMNLQGIATDGIRPWNDPEKIKIYYCIQTWQGEGQWRSSNLEELGLYPSSIHPCTAAIHFSSIGSWSTGRYLPMVVIEDMETNKVWYFQIETSSNWHFEIGCRGSWTEEKESLFLHADGADDRFGGWSKILQPGESFTSVSVAAGCCNGGFNEAVKELTKYRRVELKPENIWKGTCPVIFNDYMNCLWADPSKDKLIPIIDMAAKVGAEYFCIDAGWFADKNDSWAKRLGDWNEGKDRFGDEGLLGILGYIRAKGMIPGLWLEMEVCGEDSQFNKKHDEWFLMRNGRRVGGRERYFLNFMNPEVKDYLHGVIDRLVGMGVGYIKNDYNACIGIGCENDGNSYADGLVSHTSAFYGFVDEIRAKHKHLILENCASGAMREDYGILSHFHLQSISDQEIYYNYPSILGGGLAAVLPEQLGIWTFPFPLLFCNIKNPSILDSDEYKRSMADGEQTIFNMVNGLCGIMNLSGRIDKMDRLNMSLMGEAICLYKKEAVHIHNSYPIWPIGFTRLNDKNSWSAVGFANEDNTRILLAVWRLGSSHEYMELPLHKLRGKRVVVRQIFPDITINGNSYYNQDKGVLTVYLNQKFQARFFEIVIT